MSDNELLEELNVVFNNACYSHFNEFVEQLESIENINELMEAMEPHYINAIIINSTKSLTAVLLELSDRCNITNLGLSRLKYKKEIESIFKNNFNQFNIRLSSFDEKLSLFRMRLQSWQDESSNDSFQSAFLGGLLGGILAGPLGAGIGAAIFGSGDSSADEDCKRELNSLLSKYQAIIKELETCLDTCLEDADECFMEIVKSIPDDEKKLLE